jgi:penicillin-binding protein 1A
MPVDYALAHSVNTVAVKVLRDLGINKSIRYLDKFMINIDSKKDKNDSSLALGQLTNGESLLNITNAYTAFLNGGLVASPRSYLYVTDNYGNVVLSNETAHKRVISSETSQIMTKMLQNVIKQGTGKSVRITNENIDIAGKTGTSSNNEDRWFIGYTPDYVCGIWTGFDTPTPINSSNPSCSLFNAIFEKIYDNQDETSKFLLSDIIYEEEICIESGKKANEECKKDEKSVLGYYKASDKLDYCDIHKLNFQSELKKTKKRTLWHIFS